MSYVLGIDTSTTATKAVIVDPDGAVVGVASSDYGFDTPRPGWTEQSPELWWSGTKRAIGSVLSSTGISAADISCVGIAGQMHGAVLLAKDGTVVRPAILWNDHRTEAECLQIETLLGDQLIPLTGSAAMTGFTASKLLWIQRHEPELWDQVAHILLPKDYVRFRLSGDVATDVSDASGTQLFNISLRAWSDEMLDALGIEPGLLPTAHEGPAVTGTVSSAGAADTGLVAGTPVVAGAGDQAANGVGVGAVNPGIVTISLGTSGVVFAATDQPMIDSGGTAHAFCHAVPERWHMMGVMLSAAGSLRWFRDTLAPEVAFEDLSNEAATVAAGSGGLTFLPYLTGERTPHADPNVRGGFVGLSIDHRRSHLVRSVMEGVVFGLKDGLDCMLAAGVPSPDRVRISGGGAKSPLWRQIIADTMDCEVATTNTTEGAAFGAALLATVGAGWFSTVGAATELIEERIETTPGADRHLYAELHERYRRLYPALKGLMPTVSPAPS